MSKDVSIVFKASDNLSNSILQMKKNVGSLSRDVTEYRKIQSLAFDKKTEIRFEITKAKQELKELEQAVKSNKDGSVSAFKEKAKQVELLNEEYRRLGRAANDAAKAERSLQEDISKTSNKNASRGSSMISGLATAGLGNMLGNAVQNSLMQNITATYGASTGAMVSNVAGSTISGAAIGSLAGPIGVAVGAAVGGLTGAINGLAEKQQKDDDYFRQEVSDLFSEVKNDRQASLDNGIGRSSDAVQNRMALGTLLGSQEQGDKLFEDIRLFGINTPYQAANILNSAKQMSAYGIKSEDIIPDINMLGDVAMGNQAKFDSLAYVYAQTQSAGKLTGQDLKQYTEAGFNPLKILAEESGKSLEVMRDKMSDGLISADDVTRAFKIATSEGGQFYGAMAAQMETYAGKLAMLTDVKNEIDWAMGDGYTQERQKGIEKETELLSGEVGKKMKDAYNLMGQFQADLENKHQESIINAITEAQKTDEYQKALVESDGSEMGRIIAEAKAKAEIEYKNSEGYRLQLDADLLLVKSIQEDAALNNEYIKYGRKMGDAFSLGYSSAVKPTIGKPYIPEYTSQYTEDGYTIQYTEGVLSPRPNGYATGLGKVPDDGFYYLHEGEKVVNRVDSQKDKGSVGVTNNFYITNSGQNPYEITKEIVNNIVKASESYVGG